MNLTQQQIEQIYSIAKVAAFVVTTIVPTTLGFLMWFIRKVDIGGQKRLAEYIKTSTQDNEATKSLIKTLQDTLTLIKLENEHVKLMSKVDKDEMQLKYNILYEDMKELQTEFVHLKEQFDKLRNYLIAAGMTAQSINDILDGKVKAEEIISLLMIKDKEQHE